jgi:hypothetical protein
MTKIMIDEEFLDKVNNAPKKFNLINQLLFCACEYGDLEIIKYVMESSDFKVKPDINYLAHGVFCAVCKSGNLDAIEYILNHPTNNSKEDISYINQGLFQACKDKNLEVGNFLLYSDKLKKNANVDKLLVFLCQNGYTELIKYIITEPELKKELDINKKIKKYFENALKYNQLDVVKYFIFELNISQKKVNGILQKNQAKTVNEWLEKRELHLSLKNELSISDNNFKKNKI